MAETRSRHHGESARDRAGFECLKGGWQLSESNRGHVGANESLALKPKEVLVSRFDHGPAARCIFCPCPQDSVPGVNGTPGLS